MTAQMSVIIPAHNEEGYIGGCLDGLMAQDWPGEAGAAEIIVSTNGCTDQTVPIARSYTEQALAKGWTLSVLEIPKGSKIDGLNAADAVATAAIRAYLDADVVCSRSLMGQIFRALDQDQPRYASGRLIVTPAKSWVTRHYARIWSRLPFMTDGVPGAGLFAVNAAGRARWGAFPAVISDDTYVRLMFTPEERIGVDASYLWPMIEGFQNLVRVRRRQDAGVDEIRHLYPDIMANEGKASLGLAGLVRLFVSAPVGFLVYASVSLAVKMGAKDTAWSRGR